jgi:cell division septation protein DedD
MTTIQLQRIIGVVLLFSVIIGIAMILIRSADDGVPVDNTEQISSLGFEADSAEITKPYVSEARINLEGSAQISDEMTLAPTVVEPDTAPASKVTQAVSAPTPKVTQAVPAPTPKVTQAVPAPTPKVTQAVPAPIPKVTQAVPIPAPKVTQAEPTVAWVIQLASFSVKANADALSLQAKQMGYKSVIENSEGSNGKIYRVRLEPIADKLKAQAVASELNKKLKLSSQVLQE